MHNDKGINVSRCFTLLIARGATVARAPRRQRRVALFPLKDVALFLSKEQGKETEAVNVCIIKRK